MNPNTAGEMQAFPSTWSGGMNMVCHYAGLAMQGRRAGGSSMSSSDLADASVDDAEALVLELRNQGHLDPYDTEARAIDPPLAPPVEVVVATMPAFRAPSCQPLEVEVVGLPSQTRRGLVQENS